MAHRAVDMTVTGEVQGVNYRSSCVDAARGLGVTGWVRNEADGSVRVHAEGEPDAVDRLVEWCRTGPGPASVDDVRVTEATPDDCRGFEQRD